MTTYQSAILIGDSFWYNIYLIYVKQKMCLFLHIRHSESMLHSASNNTNDASSLKTCCIVWLQIIFDCQGKDLVWPLDYIIKIGFRLLQTLVSLKSEKGRNYFIQNLYCNHIILIYSTKLIKPYINLLNKTFSNHTLFRGLFQ